MTALSTPCNYEYGEMLLKRSAFKCIFTRLSLKRIDSYSALDSMTCTPLRPWISNSSKIKKSIVSCPNREDILATYQNYKCHWASIAPFVGFTSQPTTVEMIVNVFNDCNLPFMVWKSHRIFRNTKYTQQPQINLKI